MVFIKTKHCFPTSHVTLASYGYPVFGPFDILVFTNFLIILLSGLLTIEIYTRNTAYPLSRISAFLLTELKKKCTFCVRTHILIIKYTCIFKFSLKTIHLNMTFLFT